MEDRRSPPETQRDSGVQRRDVLALGAVAAVGTGLGPTTAAAFNVQEDVDDEGTFVAALTGNQQTDSVETDATGGAVFSLLEGGDELEFSLLINAIEDVDQAHIHLGEVGEDGPVVVWLYPEPGANEPELLEGRVDGVLATETIADDDVGDEADGSVATLVEEIRDGNAYVNVHTRAYPDGEIRGQLVTVQDAAAAILDADEIGDTDNVDDPDDEEESNEVDDDDVDDEPDDDDVDDEDVITFLDCFSVRIVGDFPEVVIYPLELMEPGDEPGEPEQWIIGAMGSFPVGPVDGERVIDMREELGDRVIISAVDVLDDEFTVGEPIHERIHPDRDECIEQLFVDAGVEPPENPFGEVLVVEPDDDEEEEPDEEDPVDDPIEEEPEDPDANGTNDNETNDQPADPADG
jgi:hypothetical protein